MAQYLDKTGLIALWSKIKAHVSTAVSEVSNTLGEYTINGKKISTNPSLTKSDVGLDSVTNDAQVKRSEMGVANGVATLGANGKVPASQLDIDTTLFQVVTSLPSSDIKTNIVYLVAGTSSDDQNKYTEYIRVNDAWEKIGEFTANVDLSGYVKGPSSSTAEHVVTFDGTNGKTIKDSGFTIEKSVPSDAKFTDTDTKVSSVGNHYTPTENQASALNASGGIETDVASSTVSVVTGLKRDAAGHVVGVTSVGIKTNATNDSAIGTSDIDLICV
ncbi:MAG: hypothetical protein J1E37_04200 [Prevotella sp.]|nr:hypothetical protein [Prevotella sp.]